MKKLTNILLTLAIATVILMSCGGNKTKEMLARKWQFSEFKIEGMEEQMAQMKAVADTTKDSTMKAQIANQVKMVEGEMEEMKKSTLEYKNDGTFEANIVSMMGPQSIKGTWVLSEDNKKVIIVDDKQKADTMNVDEITADKFVSTSARGGKKATTILVPAK